MSEQRHGASRQVADILINPDGASVKRIAWAFGCAKKDSDEECALYRVLRERMERVIAERDGAIR